MTGRAAAAEFLAWPTLMILMTRQPKLCRESASGRRRCAG